MITLLKDWKGEIEINDKIYTAAELSKIASNSFSDDIHIKLRSAQQKSVQSVLDASDSITEYRITVKKYMTEKASAGFDFMAKWNNDVPMPMRTMQGTIEKETRGMVYMNLHGQGFPVKTCLRCGRTLTNPVSMIYGIGPECMSKLGLVREIDEVEAIKLALTEIKWSGWIIKSAITEREEVVNDNE